MTTILIIEDVQEIREDICRILEFEGYETREAVNGKEALEDMKEKIPDLILCDVIMPEMDGYKFLDIIRYDERYATIPFAFLSATNQDEQYDTSKLFIRKPCVIDDLLAAVTQLLEEN